MGANELKIYRGDDKIYDLTIKDSEGEVVNITGYTVRFTVRKNAKDTITPLIFKSTGGNGISLIDPVNGLARLVINNADTNLAIGKYAYDIEVVDTAARISTVVQDNFRVLQDVTRV